MNEIMRFVPPPTLAPMRQGSRLNPPLGDLHPETRHLNLRWSMVRLDALKIMLANKNLSVDEIAKAFGSTPDEVWRLAHEMSVVILARYAKP